MSVLDIATCWAILPILTLTETDSHFKRNYMRRCLLPLSKMKAPSTWRVHELSLHWACDYSTSSYGKGLVPAALLDSGKTSSFGCPKECPCRILWDLWLSDHLCWLAHSPPHNMKTLLKAQNNEATEFQTWTSGAMNQYKPCPSKLAACLLLCGAADWYNSATSHKTTFVSIFKKI